MGARVRPPPHLGLTALSLLLAAPAFALTRPPDCGIAIAEGQAFSLLATGLLLVPGYLPGDREVRPALGTGATFRDGLPASPSDSLVAVDLLWSAGVSRRIAGSRFLYRGWSMNVIDPSGCSETHHGESRFTLAFGIELVRSGAFQLEVGVGPQLQLYIRSREDDIFRDSSLGLAPFVRVAYDSTEDSVGVEVIGWYMANAASRMLHKGQLDVTFFLRFEPLTLTATLRGEVADAPHPFIERFSLLTASGSVLLGTRL